MRKTGPIFTAFMVVSLLLSGCGQQKVMDTEFIRLQNKVKDLENVQKQKDEELSRLNQKLADMEVTVKQHNGQIGSLLKANEIDQEIHPVIIQDVKVTSEKMDDRGRIWGPFDLNITLYNGTDHDISDNLSAILISDHPTQTNESPKLESLAQRFDIKSKESKVVTFRNIPVNDPAKRLNVVIKLLEQASTPIDSGVAGKTTSVIVPTIIFPPNGQ